MLFSGEWLKYKGKKKNGATQALLNKGLQYGYTHCTAYFTATCACCVTCCVTDTNGYNKASANITVELREIRKQYSLKFAPLLNNFCITRLNEGFEIHNLFTNSLWNVPVARNPTVVEISKGTGLGQFLEVGHSKHANSARQFQESCSWESKSAHKPVSIMSLWSLNTPSLACHWQISPTAKAAIEHCYALSSPSHFTVSPFVELLNTLNQSVLTNWFPLQVHYEN